MKNKAFTLIELLVVIVIIGILATISTATFSGYFAKARDVERGIFVSTGKKILINTSTDGIPPIYSDYASVRNLFEAQGFDYLNEKNKLPILFIADPEYFLFIGCKEDALGETISAGDNPNKYFHIGSNAPLEITLDGFPSSSNTTWAISPSANQAYLCGSEYPMEDVVESMDSFSIGTSSSSNSPYEGFKVSE